MLRNEIANLAQNVKPGPCWFDFFVFHACRVAGSNRQANTFFNFLRDGCEQFFEDFNVTMQEHFRRYKGKVSFFFDENGNEEWIAILNTVIKAARNLNPQIGEPSFVDNKTDRGIPCQAADLFAYINRQKTETMYESDRYSSMRLLDLIIGRNAFPPDHIISKKLATLRQDQWAE